MSRVNQINEAVEDVDEILSYVQSEYFKDKWALPEKAERTKALLRDFADLLSRLEDGSLVEAAAIAAAHYDGYGDFSDVLDEWPYSLTKDPDEQESFRYQARGIVDAALAALGLQEDEDET